MIVGDQPLGGGDEVIEDVLLFGEHARAVPGVPELAAATQVGLSRPFAVALNVVAVDNEHRHFRSVFEAEPDLFGAVALGFEEYFGAAPDLARGARDFVAKGGEGNGALTAEDTGVELVELHGSLASGCSDSSRDDKRISARYGMCALRRLEAAGADMVR